MSSQMEHKTINQKKMGTTIWAKQIQGKQTDHNKPRKQSEKNNLNTQSIRTQESESNKLRRTSHFVWVERTSTTIWPQQIIHKKHPLTNRHQQS